MNTHAIAFFSLCVVAPILHGAEPASEADESARVLATEACSICHGPGGISALPKFPNLAAQPRPYLRAKMKLFRSRSINEPNDHGEMVGLTLMDDATVDALARYYANQPPPAPVSDDAALIAAGTKIFSQGVPEHGIAACAACHGANAHGFGVIPRLAGQHAEYVQHQLTQIQMRLRDAPIMHGIIKDMTPDDIKAVAVFVQSK